MKLFEISLKGLKDRDNLFVILWGTLPRLGNAIDDAHAAFKSAGRGIKGTISGLKAAGKGLGSIISAHPYITAVAAITAVVAGMSG